MVVLIICDSIEYGAFGFLISLKTTRALEKVQKHALTLTISGVNNDNGLGKSEIVSLETHRTRIVFYNYKWNLNTGTKYNNSRSNEHHNYNLKSERLSLPY